MQIEVEKNIEEKIETNELDTNLDTNSDINIENETIENEETLEEKQSESVETNCLALTVRKDYNLSILKNGLATTVRVSWKVALSTFILNLLAFLF